MSSWATCSRVPTWFRSCFDDGRVCAILTNDELIPEVAAQSGAMIVTHNTKDFAGLGVAVRTPAEFLKILRESVMVRIPEELYNKAVEIAEAQHVTVDEVFARRSLSNWRLGND